MTERESVEPRLLTPEYWDGHGFEDDCAWKQSVGRPSTYGLDKPGRDILRRFLEEQANAVRIRKLSKGEAFDVQDAHPAMTTVLHFTEERLDSNPTYKDKSPYDRTDFWGVVVQSALKDREKVLRGYIERLEPVGVYPGVEFDSVLREGEVVHQRELGRKNYNIEKLRRVSNIEVYVIGGGARARSPERSPLPNAGMIFRPAPGTV